jgi:hypothetical protein
MDAQEFVWQAEMPAVRKHEFEHARSLVQLHVGGDQGVDGVGAMVSEA